MPVGTRGGTRVDYLAPRDGEYDIKARIGRGIDYDIPHFLGEQQLEISVDGERVQVFTAARHAREMPQHRAPGRASDAPPARAATRRSTPNGDPLDDGRRRETLDDDWVVRVPLKAGVHEIRATFLMKTGAVSEGFRKPFLKPYIGRGTDDERETREGRGAARARDHGPAQPWRRRSIAELSARLRLSSRQGRAEEAACAKTDPLDAGAPRLSPAGHRRRHQACCSTSTTQGRAERRLRSRHRAGAAAHPGQPVVPVPHRVRARRRAPSAGAYRISDLELASRLSFFLWSSIPDDELLDLATQGKLHEPAVLERQTRRMLADPRSRGVHHQLRRAVAVAAPAAGHRAGSVPVPRLRRHAGAGVPAGSRALLRQHRARGPAGARSADGELHVRQRAAGAALRHPQREGHQLPPRRRWPTTARVAACWARAAS